MLFSALIPFKDWFTGDYEYIEDIIYFRGILLGAIFISVGSAIVTKNLFIRDAIISVGSGIFSLFFISTLNLLIDNNGHNLIETEVYFDFTFKFISVVFIILTVIRLWLNKLLMFLDFLVS